MKHPWARREEKRDLNCAHLYKGARNGDVVDSDQFIRVRLGGLAGWVGQVSGRSPVIVIPDIGRGAVTLVQ